MQRYTILAALLMGSLGNSVAQDFCDIDENLGLPTSLDVGCAECVELTAEFPELFATTEYTVNQLDDATPPYPLNEGTVTISTTDDVWSPLIPIGFDFCFFGQNYSNIVIGSNGLVTFNAASAGQFCPWSFNQQNPNPGLPTNSIFGVFHDVNPASCGNIRYASYGEAPCRVFVVNFDDICLFSCTSLQSSSQIVIHENTNIIDVYNVQKSPCAGWNSGNSLIGIQNQGGTVGYSPPGRNTGNWSASNEAFRFTPSGEPSGDISWFEGETFIGDGATIEVCPEEPGTYFAALNYDLCSSGGSFGDGCAEYSVNVTSGTFPSEVSWNITGDGTVFLSGGAPFNGTVCLPNGCYTLNMFDSFGDGWNGADFSISFEGTTIATATLPTGSAGTANFCVDEFVPDDDEEPEPDPVIEGFIVAQIDLSVLIDDIELGLAAPPPACNDGGEIEIPFSEPDGLWEADCGSCIEQDGTFILDGLPAGSYEVIYTVEGACGPVADTVIVAVESPADLQLTAPEAICEFSDPVELSASPAGGVWSADCDDCFTEDAVFNPAGQAAGTYTFSYLLEGVCTVSDEVSVMIEPTFSAQLEDFEPICENETLQLLADVDGGIWSADCGGCIDSENGLFTGAIAGSGNFTVFYDFDELCSIQSSTEVTVSPTVDASIDIIPELCESGSQVQFNAADEGGVWIADCNECLTSDGLFDPEAAGAGEYLVTYEITDVCSDIDLADVVVLAQRSATFTILSPLCIDGGLFTPVPEEQGGVWTADCDDCIDVNSGAIDLPQAGEGDLEITYTFDGLCGDSFSAMTELIPCSIEIPNIFTPNNDGVNDALVFQNLHFFPNSRLVVMNRWGQIVFEDDNYNRNNNWRGDDLNDGTYYFILTLTDGTEHKGPIKLVRGIRNN